MGSGNRRRGAWLAMLTLLASSCTIPAGNPTDHFDHRFEITYEGERLIGGGGELVFSASPDDFYHWQNWVDSSNAVDGKAGIANLVPNYQVETTFDDPEADRLCLTEPMEFFDSETLEQVYAIPVGTCLENDGTTEIVIVD